MTNELVESDFQQALDSMEDFCPFWVAKIRSGNLNYEDGKDLSVYEYCFVGEVYNNSSNYGCNICKEFALNMYRSAKAYDGETLEINERFRKELINFSVHIKDHKIGRVI